MTIRDYSGQDLIRQLNTGRLSVLEAMDARDLKNEMRPIGRLCRFVLRWICLKKADKGLRQRAASIVRLFAPVRLLKKLPKHDDAVVIGFNHPSLGEVCRFLYLGFRYYPDKEFLFPVNLPWYESVAKAIPLMNRLGIRVTPMITPATEAKLMAKAAGNEEKIRDIQRIKMIFDRQYIREVKEIAAKKGILFIAPSATRQKEIIGANVYPTMTAAAHLMLKSSDSALFIPVTVFAPKHGNRELNLLRYYSLEPCSAFTAEEVKLLTGGRDRAFDYAFLQRIQDTYDRRVAH